MKMKGKLRICIVLLLMMMSDCNGQFVEGENVQSLDSELDVIHYNYTDDLTFIQNFAQEGEDIEQTTIATDLSDSVNKVKKSSVVPKKGVHYKQSVSPRKGANEEDLTPSVSGRKGVELEDLTPSVSGRKGVELEDSTSAVSGRKGVEIPEPKIVSEGNVTAFSESDMMTSGKIYTDTGKNNVPSPQLIVNGKNDKKMETENGENKKMDIENGENSDKYTGDMSLSNSNVNVSPSISNGNNTAPSNSNSNTSAVITNSNGKNTEADKTKLYDKNWNNTALSNSNRNNNTTPSNSDTGASLPNSNATLNTVSISNSNSSIHLKPNVAKDNLDFDLDSSPQPESDFVNYSAVIFGIIVTIVLMTLIVVGYRRFKDFWLRRHYAHVDFLVEGMYEE